MLLPQSQFSLVLFPLNITLNCKCSAVQGSCQNIQNSSPMASNSKKPHFLLFPFMAQGHMIPMVDLAKLLAQQGAIITIVTTPQNASRHESILTRASRSGLQIQLLLLHFPFEQAGLPNGCENVDLLPSLSMATTFFKATYHLSEASEILFQNLTPPPNCIISDMCLPWTNQIAQKFHVPRIVFYSLSCFFLSCMRSLILQRDDISYLSDSESVTLLDPPHQVEFRKSQLPISIDEETSKFEYDMIVADRSSYGVIVNTFEEMEPKYVEEFKTIRAHQSDKIWCVGPLSLSNKNKLDKVERGNKSSIDEQECMEWLDEQQTCSVIYVSFGSLSNLVTEQMIELGLGLEASNKPFIWVMRKMNITEEFEKWVTEYEFEEKIKGRGVVVRGWAPQVLILSHSAIGGFLTHCGWNSTIEAMSAGVPMITWPLFADQVFNEKLIVKLLRIGVSIGVETCISLKEGVEKDVLVKRENVTDAIDRLMEGGDESKERRERCKKVAEEAHRAVEEEEEEGGSSHLNLKLFFEDIVHQTEQRDYANC